MKYYSSVKDFHMTNYIEIHISLSSVTLFLLGPAREAFEHGVQLARGFPPRGKWTYGEVFHPAVVPQPLFRFEIYMILA